MSALPIGTETLFGPTDAPWRQEARLLTYLAGGQVMQRVVPDNQSTLGFELQLIEILY